MSIKIALAGNPNCGKTTLFNALTGSNQFVGNWPGVTVEKKEGKLKKHNDVIVTDLPGIYSLSPYTLEEVVARNYLIDEQPDVILNIIDGTNLERNLYLTTQLTELGIPVVCAVNMMDVVNKNGDKINVSKLSEAIGCKVIEISALKNEGISEAAEAAISAADTKHGGPVHRFDAAIEHALAHIEEACVHDLPDEQQRWYAIKLFERDDKVIEKLGIKNEKLAHINKDIEKVEKELDDDSESIITNERYNYISNIIDSCLVKKNKGALSTSDKIDKIVTNRWLGLPIFAAIMFAVYWIAMVGVGAPLTDFTNDNIFGEDGFHFLGKIITFGENDEPEALRLAACLEEHYPHSIANAVVKAASDRGLVHEELHSEVEYVVAHGIASSVSGVKVVLGSYHFVFEDEGCTLPENEKEKFDTLPDEYSHLFLAVGGILAAVICIEDPIREEAKEVLSQLKELGITKIVMMTGDSERTAKAVANKVGVDEYYAEVLPEDKAEYVRREKRAGRKVIMIGDGVNDSPALSEADAGIAISSGAAIAKEVADITISADDLRCLVTLRQLSASLMKRINSNYRTIIGFNFSLMVLGASGVIAPTTSALLHNSSTLAISLASMRNYLK